MFNHLNNYCFRLFQNFIEITSYFIIASFKQVKFNIINKFSRYRNINTVVMIILIVYIQM